MNGIEPKQKEGGDMKKVIVAIMVGLVIGTAGAALADCFGNCASDQGICIGQCQGNGQCIANCQQQHGRCISRCR